MVKLWILTFVCAASLALRWFVAVAYKFIIRSSSWMCFSGAQRERKKSKKILRLMYKLQALHWASAGGKRHEAKSHWIGWNWKFSTKWQWEAEKIGQSEHQRVHERNVQYKVNCEWQNFWQINYNETEKRNMAQCQEISNITAVVVAFTLRETQLNCVMVKLDNSGG